MRTLPAWRQAASSLYSMGVRRTSLLRRRRPAAWRGRRGGARPRRRSPGPAREPLGVAERHPDAGQELLQAEGLGEVVVGARVEGLRPCPRSWPRAERMMMGAWLHSRRRRVTSRPSTSGRPRSSITRSGLWAAARAGPRAPRRRLNHLVALGGERGRRKRRIAPRPRYEDPVSALAHGASASFLLDGAAGAPSMGSVKRNTAPPPARSSASIRAAVRLHDAAADGEAEAGAARGRRARRISRRCGCRSRRGRRGRGPRPRSRPSPGSPRRDQRWRRARGVYLAAFSSRLTRTCSTRTASNGTRGRSAGSRAARGRPPSRLPAARAPRPRPPRSTATPCSPERARGEPGHVEEVARRGG